MFRIVKRCSRIQNMIQSLERGLLILNVIAKKADWVGVRELARETGLTISTAQNLLKTLQKSGYLEFEPSLRKYKIGISVLRLGYSLDPVIKNKRIYSFIYG